jgi:hypothetical protein
MLIKCKKEQPPKKATGSDRNVRYRAKKREAEQSIIDLYNHIHFGDLPVVSVEQLFPKVSTKGHKRPNFNPPDHLRKNMTDEQISEWRWNEKKKRKALKMRESRARKAAVLKLKRIKDEVDKHIKKMAIEAVEPAVKTKATSTQANASDHELPVTAESIGDFEEIDAFLEDALVEMEDAAAEIPISEESFEDALVEMEDAAAEIPISEESLDDTLIRDVNLDEVFDSREDPGSEGPPAELGVNLNKVFEGPPVELGINLSKVIDTFDMKGLSSVL